MGEACHFVDLLFYLTGSPIVNSDITFLDGDLSGDTFVISLRFNDGSIASINYFSNGSSLVPKEDLRVYASGDTFHLSNFRKLTHYSGHRKRSFRSSFDKGHLECMRQYLQAVKKGLPSPIPFEDIYHVQSTMLRLQS